MLKQCIQHDFLFVCDFSERYVQNTVKKSAILVNFLELVLTRVVET